MESAQRKAVVIQIVELFSVTSYILIFFKLIFIGV